MRPPTQSCVCVALQGGGLAGSARGPCTPPGRSSSIHATVSAVVTASSPISSLRRREKPGKASALMQRGGSRGGSASVDCPAAAGHGAPPERIARRENVQDFAAARRRAGRAAGAASVPGAAGRGGAAAGAASRSAASISASAIHSAVRSTSRSASPQMSFRMT